MRSKQKARIKLKELVLNIRNLISGGFIKLGINKMTVHSLTRKINFFAVVLIEILTIVF